MEVTGRRMLLKYATQWLPLLRHNFQTSPLLLASRSFFLLSFCSQTSLAPMALAMSGVASAQQEEFLSVSGAVDDIVDQIVEENKESTPEGENTKKWEEPMVIDLDDEDEENMAAPLNTDTVPVIHDDPKENKVEVSSVVDEIVLSEEESEEPASKKSCIDSTAESGAGSEGIKKVVKLLSRKQLEGLVTKKILECLNFESELGQLKAKMTQMSGTKEKLFHKTATLQKQVVEMSKAMRGLVENKSRDSAPKNHVPLKFYRSVGLQVGVENMQTLSRLQSQTRKVEPIRTTKLSPGLIPLATTAPTSIGNNNMINGQRRYGKTTISVADITKSIGKKSNSPPKAGSRQAQSLVDLTDEKGVNGNNVMQNGVQYRIVNGGGQPLGGNVQLLSTSTGYRIVTPGGQTRPVLFAQNAKNGPQNVPIRPNNIGGKPTAVTGPLNRSSLGQNSPIRKFTLPPLPPASTNTLQLARKAVKEIPPRPSLTLQEQSDGIVLSWTLKHTINHAEIQSYQIFACQEPLTGHQQGQPSKWKRVGDVKALPLPMACTLSQFTEENRYHFIVRGQDAYNRTGHFCDPVSIILKKKH